MSAEVVQTPVETEKPSDTKESTEAPVEAAKLLAQGKRNLLCGEIPTAVNELQEACALLAASFGETAKECGDSYFYYGQSLLELARMETGVLGNALQGVPEEDTEDEAVPSEQFERAEAVTGEELEQIRDKVYDAMSEPDPPKSKEIGNVEAKEEKSGESAMETEENKENVTEEKENAPEEKVAEDGGKKPLENKSEEEIKNEKNALSDKTTEVINTDEKVIEGKDDKTDKLVNGDIDKQDKKNEVDIASDKNNSNSADGATKQLNGDGQTQTEEEAKKEAAGEEMETSAKEGEEEEGEEGGTEEDEETADEENADPGEGTSTAPQEEDADDIPNLQLAWEMLDLAKVIYLKQEGKEMRLKAAEAYLKLGEVSIESEQYEQAISDIGDCLKIQQEQLEEDDRLLAETQYQLGLAYSFHKKFDEAIDSFRGAIKVIEDRIGKLKAIIEKEKPGEEKTTEVKPEEQKTEDQSKEEAEKKTEECKEADPVKAAEKEIQDLAGILPDIRAKIEDVVEERKNMDVVREMAKEAVSSQMKAEETIGTQPISNESATKATDISHLIRKKRKPESDTEEEAETKKCRQEDGSGDANKVPNGNHPVTNGDSTPANDTDTLLTNGEKPTANGDSADSKEELKSKDCAAELKSKDVPMETAEGVST